METAEEKRRLRQTVIARRDAIAPDAREGKNVLICAQLARKVDWDELAEQKELRQWTQSIAAEPGPASQEPSPHPTSPHVFSFPDFGQLLEADQSPTLNVAVYAPLGSEPDITGFVAAAYLHRANVCYPCMERIPATAKETRTLAMAFRQVSFEQRATCPFVAHPVRGFDPDDPVLAHYPRIEPADLDVIIAPLVAFDEQGNRLGYGGGNYDRLFAETRREALIIGIAYAEQQVDAVPCESFDKPLPQIVFA